MRDLRIATCDPGTRAPRIVDLTIDAADPDPLRAARCGLGCLGVILSVTFACVPAYDVEEVLAVAESVRDVLDGSGPYPLTQFAVIPYAWRSYVFLRRRADPRRRRGLGSWLAARAHRVHKRVVVDVGLHGGIKVLAGLGWARLTRWFYRRVRPALVLRGVGVTDASTRVLTHRHDLYRHVEMEVFVPEDALVDALGLVQDLTDAFAGVRPLTPPVQGALAARAPGALAELEAGRFTYHYVIPCRRVLADDALVSMTADGRPAWALGFFSYAGLEPGFARYCRAVALALVALHGARLHWGKYFPLRHAEGVQDAYPGLPRFRALCLDHDRAGALRSPDLDALLGFTADPQSTR